MKRACPQPVLKRSSSYSVWGLIRSNPKVQTPENWSLILPLYLKFALKAQQTKCISLPSLQLLNGDKDTYRFAWMAVKQPFSFVRQPIGTAGMIDSKKELCGTTMVQFDLDGHEIFLHHNMLKSGPLKAAGANWAEAKIPVAGPMEQFKPVPGDALELADETSINCMDISGRYDVKLRPFKEFEEKYFDSHAPMTDPWLLTNTTERFKVEVPDDSMLAAIQGVNLKGTIAYELSFPSESAPNVTRLKIELSVAQSKEEAKAGKDALCESKVWLDQVLLPLGRCSGFGSGHRGKTVFMHNKFYLKMQAKDTGQGKCNRVFELVAQPFSGVITRKSVKLRLCGRIPPANTVRCLNTSVKLHMPRCRGKPLQKPEQSV